jgi:hypothetical protein
MRFDRDVFYGRYRSVFGRLHQNQVNGLNQMLNFAEADPNFSSIRQLAYAFATVQRETNVSREVDGVKVPMTFNPIHEKGKRSYFDQYEWSTNLGNNRSGDGFLYRGRGYVQVTGRRNYTEFSRLLGIDLISNPDLALTPQTAWSILSIGMRHGVYIPGETLDKYIPKDDKKTADYFNARKIVNRGEVRKKPAVVREMAENAVRWEALLRAALLPDEAAPEESLSEAKEINEIIEDETMDNPFDSPSLLFNGIYFPPNGSPAEIQGRIGGEAQDIYIGIFRKETQLSIEFSFAADSEMTASGFETSAGFSVSKGSLEGADFGLKSDDGKTWQGVIPESGIYYISVLAHPVADYTLKITAA